MTASASSTARTLWPMPISGRWSTCIAVVSATTVRTRIAPLAPLLPNRTAAARTSGTGKYSTAGKRSMVINVRGISSAIAHVAARARVNSAASIRRARLGMVNATRPAAGNQARKIGARVRLPSALLRYQRHQNCP